MKHLVAIGAGNLTKSFMVGWTPYLEPLNMKLSVLARSEAYRERGWPKDLIAPTLDPEVLTDACVVLLAVKPKDRARALQQIHAYAPSHSLIVSVLAGIPISSLKAALPGYGIVRAMPNVAVATGLGTTVVVESEDLGHPAWPWMRQALEQLGRVVVIKEALIDAATAISGSGPAYVYLLLQALIDAAQAMGLPGPMARELAVHTVRGAAEVAGSHPEVSLSELTAWVASKGGTTEAALDLLRRTQVGENLQQAILQARTKAAELADQ